MIGNNENRNWGSITFILVILFFIFVCGSSEDSSARSTTKNYTFELVSELHSANSAILEHQKVSSPKRSEFLNENFAIKYFSKESNLIFSNIIANKKISILHQNHILIKPLNHSRFYFYFHIITSDDIPFLS